MAMTPTPDPLRRAVGVARTDRPSGWVELSNSIMARVRATVTPAQPLLTFTEHGGPRRDAQDSRTYVSERVVTAALRRLLRRPTHVLANIDLMVESDRLTAVHVDLVCSYGPELKSLGERARVEILGEVHRILGTDPDLALDHVSVTFIDIVDGNPITT